MSYELTPKLLPGKIVEVTDLGIKVMLKGRMGIIQMPHRSVITDKPPQIGQEIQMYVSYIQVL